MILIWDVGESETLFAGFLVADKTSRSGTRTYVRNPLSDEMTAKRNICIA